MHATSGTDDKARRGGRSQTNQALTRHARLGFNTRSAVAEFLLGAWHQRRGDGAAQEHPSDSLSGLIH
jgi:hypothetical protein